jgi:hypothetical protein
VVGLFITEPCGDMGLSVHAVRWTIPVTALKNVRWSILILREKAVWLGDVEATSEAEAIAKGAEEFKQDPNRLMAVRRG